MVPWTHLTAQHKQYFYRDRQTDRQTDHATRSVTVGHIYVRNTAFNGGGVELAPLNGLTYCNAA